MVDTRARTSPWRMYLTSTRLRVWSRAVVGGESGDTASTVSRASARDLQGGGSPGCRNPPGARGPSFPEETGRRLSGRALEQHDLSVQDARAPGARDGLDPSPKEDAVAHDNRRAWTHEEGGER